MSLDDMMRFRISYLKSIAKAWNDPAFFEQMTSADCGWSCLAGPLPRWDIDLEFRRDKLAGNGYRPAETGGWVGPDFALQLRLPPGPTSEVEQLTAITRYYALLPSPFGQLRKGEKHCRDNAKTCCDRPDADLAEDSSDGAGGSGMGHWADALVLGGVIVRALALSWSNADFKQQLASDALTALENWLGYNSPWNMSLSVDFEQGGSRWNGKDWHPKPRNLLRLFVPNRPTLDVSGQPVNLAVALAAYNQTGDAYPLTCP